MIYVGKCEFLWFRIQLLFSKIRYYFVLMTQGTINRLFEQKSEVFLGRLLTFFNFKNLNFFAFSRIKNSVHWTFIQISNYFSRTFSNSKINNKTKLYSESFSVFIGIKSFGTMYTNSEELIGNCQFHDICTYLHHALLYLTKSFLN